MHSPNFLFLHVPFLCFPWPILATFQFDYPTAVDQLDQLYSGDAIKTLRAGGTTCGWRQERQRS